jgi:hypothetical protein
MQKKERKNIKYKYEIIVSSFKFCGHFDSDQFWLTKWPIKTLKRECKNVEF